MKNGEKLTVLEPDTNRDAGRAAAFAPTHWTVVLSARGDSPGAAEALGRLCRDYWFPLYAYVRRKGFDLHEAQDMTQEFFARLLEGKSLESVDPAKGKFRSFLLASMGHFLSNEWARRRTEKRGGKAVLLSLDDSTAEDRYRLEPASEMTPEKMFERRWALTLLDKALAELKSEYAADGKSAQFQGLQGFLTGDTAPNACAECAAKLEITEGAVRVAVHRMRRRMGELLRVEIARTVGDEKAVDEEIQHMFAALADG